MANYNAMTTEELNAKSRELSKVLNSVSPADDRWDEAYKEYSYISAVLDDRYREENQEAFNKFYKENIEGKKWEEIDDDTWQWYSDWHKDMYGYRPRHM